MEESNLINNDNTYNTDMSTSQSTIDGNATTNNKFNKDDLQEVTGGGGGGIATPPTKIVDGYETTQTTGTLTPILLILGDGTTTDEEPVLLEEDEDITYKAVINSDYESNIPTINLEGSEVSYCDANYVIAVTETDKNIPVSYSSTNLSVSFTNNQDWCSVIFKSPLEVADQLKLPLNSDNFPDNSKIIVPVISCEENNTGQERNTTITFNIKNVAISHNIQMNVQQTYKKPMTFVVGDVLYSTADEKLTLDAQTNGVNNTPIAICVIPDVYENLKNGDESEEGVHTARFVSLNYMNCDSPSTGNKDTQLMYFGNYQVTIGNTRGGTTKDSQVGGKWNTKRCVFKATNQDKTSGKVENKSDAGYCAPACCCDRYSTPGTKQGDWYLPSIGELYQLYENKTAIDEKRTAIKGSGFSSGVYWSSRENSSENEYRVGLRNGNIDYYYKNDGIPYVLGFLAVEVPSFNIPSFKPQVNMDPVKLDPSSKKKTLVVGDVLYSTSDGKLTLDKTTNSVTNTAIAICVIPEVIEHFKNGDNSDGAVKTARFVSINYMNYNTPSIGSKTPQDMYFGNSGTTIGNVKGGTDKTSYIGGKWNTQQCLSKATNQDPYIYAGVTNNSDTGYCAPACCCVAYSTPGTKPGDWYLPSIGELYQIYANKASINEKRTAIKGSGFGDSNYWSSREYSSNYEYRVGLDRGGIGYSSQNYNAYVLGFLALEV